MPFTSPGLNDYKEFPEFNPSNIKDWVTNRQAWQRIVEWARSTQVAPDPAIQQAPIDLNTTHRLSDGSDHAFLDQAVTIASNPTFDGVNLTGILNLGPLVLANIGPTNTIARTKSRHSLGTFLGVPVQDLDTITGGVEGDLLILQLKTNGQIVIVTQNDNIVLGSTVRSISSKDVMLGLLYDADISKWKELFFSHNSVQSTTRVTTTYTILTTDDNVFAITDGGAFTVTLPVISLGVEGIHIKVINTGTSGFNLTVTPGGSNLLIGVNSSFTLLDGESLNLVYDSGEGWY